jgi:serine/threonine-protein phosphatase 2B regulatory subunit
LSIKELQGNPLLERVIDVFDENRDGEIQFSEFINSLAVFTSGNDEAKLRCNNSM